jgi:hypothetical protein
MSGFEAKSRFHAQESSIVVQVFAPAKCQPATTQPADPIFRLPMRNSRNPSNSICLRNIPCFRLWAYDRLDYADLFNTITNSEILEPYFDAGLH